MKQFLLTFLIGLLTTSLFTACSSDLDEDFAETNAIKRAPGDYPSMSDIKVTITSQGVTFEVGVNDLGDYNVKKTLGYGYLLSATEEVPPFEIGSGSTRYPCNNIDENHVFTKEVTNLKKDTQYYLRAYAILQKDGVNVDTLFSNTATFTITTMLPVVETFPVVNRARRGACVFARFKDGGNVKLSKWGICLDKKPMPTPSNCEDIQIARDTCNLAGFSGEFGAFFETLSPRTLYHTRAFVITTNKDTIFGEDRIFRTSEGGNYAWEWAANESGAKSAGAWERITEAMDSAAYYYNNYSNLYLRAHVEYNTGVQTADCSYGGWIRFGANSRYQWVGTAQHETSHGLGVGTCWNWRTLINYDGDRKWTGPVATRTLRAVMNDQTLRISGDNQHFWPGGINQREEVTTGTANSYGVYVKDERMLRCNAMILNGMQIDGLACP